MELDAIAAVIEQYGYFGLFVWLWIGVIGIPVPNELIVMSVGYAGAINLLNPVYLFLFTYLGLVAASTTCFIVGKLSGKAILRFLKKRKKTKKYVHRSLSMIKKYHNFALIIGYFLPGIRNIIPLLFGLSGLTFFKFAFISYSTVLVWTTIYFLLGLFLDRINIVEKINGLLLLTIFIAASSLLAVILHTKRRMKLGRQTYFRQN